ncbi:MAG: hypothetical protein ACE5HS_14195 [bacterium]
MVDLKLWIRVERNPKYYGNRPSKARFQSNVQIYFNLYKEIYFESSKFNRQIGNDARVQACWLK